MSTVTCHSSVEPPFMLSSEGACVNPCYIYVHKATHMHVFHSEHLRFIIDAGKKDFLPNKINEYSEFCLV